MEAIRKIFFKRIKIRIISESLWIIAGQFFSLLTSLILIKILTFKLLPSEYGNLALGLTIAGIINQFFIGGIVNGITRFYSVALHREDIPGFLNASLRLFFRITILLFFFSSLLIIILYYYNKYYWIKLSLPIILFSTLSGLNSALSNIQNAARQRSIVALHSSLDGALKILFSIILLKYFEKSAFSIVLAYIISVLFVSISQIIYFNKKIIKIKTVKFSGNTYNNWIKDIWSFSWPFSLWGLFTWLQLASDKWSLEKFVSTAEVGKYTAAFQIGYTPISTFTSLLVSLISPIYFNINEKNRFGKNKIDLQKITNHLFYLSIFLTLFTFLSTLFIHEWIFLIFVSSNYISLSYLMPWLVLAGGTFAAGQIIVIKLSTDLKTKEQIIPKIVTAIFGLILNILGAKYFGVNGVVAGNVLFSISYALWVYFLYAKKNN